MGNFYNSNADIIYKIINTLGGLAGITCLLMMSVAFVKMLTGDEQDRNIYIRRIKNGIIALILILSIVIIVRLVGKYFPVNKNYSNIGDFSDISVSMIQGVSNVVNETRQMVSIDGIIYVRTKQETKFDLESGFGWKDIIVDEYKLYSEASGTTQGAFADVQYYYFKWQSPDQVWMGKDGDKGYKNRFIPAEALKSAKKEGDIADPDGFKRFLDQYAIKDTSDGIKWINAGENPFDVTINTDNGGVDTEEIQKQDDEYRDEYMTKDDGTTVQGPTPLK